jgi:hypothetical protein
MKQQKRKHPKSLLVEAEVGAEVKVSLLVHKKLLPLEGEVEVEDLLNLCHKQNLRRVRQRKAQKSNLLKVHQEEAEEEVGKQRKWNLHLLLNLLVGEDVARKQPVL